MATRKRQAAEVDRRGIGPATASALLLCVLEPSLPSTGARGASTATTEHPSCLCASPPFGPGGAGRAGASAPLPPYAPVNVGTFLLSAVWPLENRKAVRPSTRWLGCLTAELHFVGTHCKMPTSRALRTLSLMWGMVDASRMRCFHSALAVLSCKSMRYTSSFPGLRSLHSIYESSHAALIF